MKRWLLTWKPVHFRAEGYGNENGVDILIYDINKEDNEEE